jgi:hypothetical protein
MSRYLQYGFMILGVIFLIFAVGFYFQMSWATNIWPWQDGRLSYIFIASIMASIGMPILWIGWSGEWGAMAGGAINLGISYVGISVFLFQLYSQTQNDRLLAYSLGCGMLALVNLGILFWSLRYPIHDSRQLPRLVQISFVVFTIVLLLVGSALILRSPTIFPWPLSPDTSVMFGWIFLGAAFYFIYAILNPSWHNAQGQLLGFLAYDLVLLVPFVGHLSTVKPEHMLSLVIYMVVIAFSAALAIYYLFINKPTRQWRIDQ